MDSYLACSAGRSGKHLKIEDGLDILTRTTTFVTVLCAAFLEARIIEGDERALAIALNGLASVTMPTIVYGIEIA